MKVPILFGWISTIILQNKNFYCHVQACFSSVMFGLEPDISLTDSRVKLSPPLSLPDLIRQSRDSPVEPGNDEKEKNHDNDKKEKNHGNDK